MQWSMAGVVADILMGTAVSIYAYRTLGLRSTLVFMLPVCFSH